MKEVALQRRAHTTLGQELTDFVRKKIDDQQNGDKNIHENEIRDDICQLLGIESALPKQVSDFLDHVQTKLKMEDQAHAIIKVKKRDEIRSLIPKFEK